MVFVKKSFNPTHTYVDLFIRFFLLNDGHWVGRACAPQLLYSTQTTTTPSTWFRKYKALTRLLMNVWFK